MASGFDGVLANFWQLSQMGEGALGAGLLLMCRYFGFIIQAPIFGRKDVPTQFKVPLGLLIVIAMMSHPDVIASQAILQNMPFTFYLLLVVINLLFGTFIGFAMRIVFEAIAMSGGLITSQIGLQMANIMDPSTKQNQPILGPLFNGLASIVFIYIGGIELLLKTFQKSLVMIPLHQIEQNWFAAIDIYRWIQASNDILPLAILLAAPFYITSILMDAILGIVNKTAQQIPVFQLSHSLKPLLGMITFFVTVPTLFPIMRHILTTMILRL